MSNAYLKELPKRKSEVVNSHNDEIKYPSLTKNMNAGNNGSDDSINETSQKNQNNINELHNTKAVSPIEFGPFNAIQNINISKIQELNKNIEFDKRDSLMSASDTIKSFVPIILDKASIKDHQDTNIKKNLKHQDSIIANNSIQDKKSSANVSANIVIQKIKDDDFGRQNLNYINKSSIIHSDPDLGKDIDNIYNFKSFKINEIVESISDIAEDNKEISAIKKIKKNKNDDGKQMYGLYNNENEINNANTNSRDEKNSPENSVKEDHLQEIIKLQNVQKTYILGLEGVAALRGINLSIYPGEFVCIFGTSGGGKTTLLNLIGTIDKPTKGSVHICGIKINSETEDNVLAAIRLHKMSFVFQTFNLISSLTALENVELPMQLKGELSREKIERKAQKLLAEIGLEERIYHYPKQLSGGEQQRVTIARALANDPEIMLLDEPTGDLDTKNTDYVMKTLIDLNMHSERKITMLMVTHDLNLKNYGTKIVRMVDGKIGSIIETPQDIRLKSVEELNQRISNSKNEKIKVQVGIEPKEVNPKREEILRNKALSSFPILSVSKTSVRIPNDYFPVKMTRNKGKKKHHAHILKNQ